MTANPTDPAKNVIVITRSQVRGSMDSFAILQRKLAESAARGTGFVDQAIMATGPIESAHWVTLLWFDRSQNALAWLNSTERLGLLASAETFSAEPDEVHIVSDGSTGTSTSGACAVITTRIKPGCETPYRAWQDRIGAALAFAPGFRGYRIEPPVTNMRDAWIVVMHFASEGELSAWMTSPVRLKLIREAEPFVESTRTRIAGAGLDQWLRIPDGVAIPPTWKMSMVILLGVYPTVFLVVQLVSWPLLIKNGVPAWLTTFLGNVMCVVALSVVIPWLARRFGWWLRPRGGSTRRNNAIGALVVMGLYSLLLGIFAAFSAWRA